MLKARRMNLAACAIVCVAAGVTALRYLVEGTLAWPARPNTSACATFLRQIFRRRCTVRSRPSG
jgi:hypothetical protein